MLSDICRAGRGSDIPQVPVSVKLTIALPCQAQYNDENAAGVCSALILPEWAGRHGNLPPGARRLPEKRRGLETTAA